MKKTTLALFFIITLCSFGTAFAEIPEEPNPPYGAQLDGQVNAVVANGTTVYIGGLFRNLWFESGNNILVDLDTKLPSFELPIFSGGIEASVSDGAGGFYIAGDSITVDFVDQGYIVHILSDGSIDESFSVAEANGTIRALVLSGTTLYAGGDADLLAINTLTGSVERVGTSVSGVFALGVAGSTLYVGGQFTDIDGDADFHYLVAFDMTTPEGVLIETFLPDLNGGPVRGLLPAGGRLYVGGDFTTVNGLVDTDHQSIVAVDTTTGSVVGAFSAHTNGSVASFVLDGTTLYAGGDFTEANGDTDYQYFVAFSTTDGSLVSGFQPVLDGSINSIVRDGTTLYAGGFFSSIENDESRTNIGAFDTTTGESLMFPFATESTVNTVALSSGSLYAAGSFSTLNIIRNRIAAYDIATGDLTSFDPNVNDDVYALALDGTTLYAGGAFTTINACATPSNCAAAFSTTTGVATAFDPDISNGASIVSAMVLSEDGDTIYIGGDFADVNGGGTLRDHLAAFATDTGIASSFNPQVNGAVTELLLDSTTLYAGGASTTVNAGALVRNRLAAFSTATSTATAFQPEVLGGGVFALALDDTTLYVGGEFTHVNTNTPRNRFAAFDTTTSVATDFDINFDAAVRAITVGEFLLYIAGDFTSYDNGVGGAPYAVTFDKNSETVLADTDPGFNGNVHALYKTENNFFFGGEFSDAYGGETEAYFAVYDAVIATTPTVETLEINNPTDSITETSAYLRGSPIDNGGTIHTVVGFNYGLTSSYGSSVDAGGGYDEGIPFDLNATGLECDTTYHYRAFNSSYVGIDYGEDMTFTTDACSGAPGVSTSAATAIDKTTATLNGAISSEGDDTPTARGFQYGLTTSYGTTVSESGSFSVGAFSSALTTLTCNTTYHFRSYATNTVTTSYGTDQSFTTSACSTGGGGSSGGTRNPAVPVVAVPISTDTRACRPGDTFSAATGARCSTATAPSVPGTPAVPGAGTTIPLSTRAALVIAPTLSLNKNTPSVKTLQQFLNALGYSVSLEGAGAPGKETTTFGPKTKAALIRFQTANGLVPDGIFGPKTRAVMLAQ